MTTVHLVRHGRAAAGWDSEPDPGLDETGRRQARDVAERLASMGPLDVVTSPLSRCRETAACFAEPRGLSVTVIEAVREIPSPDGVPMGERVEWLRAAMTGEWSALGARYTRYRDGVAGYIASLTVPTVVFSHFVAINAVIGRCLSDDRLVIRRLDNCSVTTVGTDGDVLTLLSGGDEADTLIR